MTDPAKLLGRIPSPSDERDYQVRTLLSLGPADLPSRYRDRSAVKVPFRFDQQEGSCVGRSSAMAKVVQERKDHRRTYRFDGLWIWSESKKRDGLPDPESNRGTYIRTALKVLHDLGARREDKPEAEISKYKIDSYYACYTLDEIKGAIYEFGPVLLGSWWYDNWFDIPADGILPEPIGSIGGHATLAYGWDDRKAVLYARNSWSANWGVNGDFLIPYRFWNLHFDEAWKAVDHIY